MTKRATIQLFILILSVAFEAVREGQGEACRSLICYEYGNIYLRWHIYYIMEHFIYIVMCWMIWDNSQKPEDVKTDRFFIFIALADFADYWVTGNNIWYRIPLTFSNDSWFFIVPFSMNLVAVVCFIIYANWQWKVNGKRF